ncbi:helix-turn-helix transcriptional regulator [Methylobacterium sp. WL12]|uniref:helix-turn-helix domain-containing protein n=1 Tax=Methylobacterium sp. WL12 TaxID=2603890 RepID=UPI0011CA305F|nr:helix-turn-helix transcriptional regulator [Methylobacterium sp. WL12]TXM60478.1 helix-turn-helix transcriptional regulator [Methylobacterium sp. WL12]
MYAHQTKLASEEVQELRREGGRYVRELREAAGLSQRQLAALIGVEFYTFVSQIETGRGRIPPDSYRIWAEALQVDARELVINLMQFYDPVTYGILGADLTDLRGRLHTQ